VNFLVHTKHEEDIAWLDELVASVPGYTSTNVPDLNYGLMWSNYMSREDTIYIKMDDDVVSFAVTFSSGFMLTEARFGLQKIPYRCS
jgi:hypothetical protein